MSRALASLRSSLCHSCIRQYHIRCVQAAARRRRAVDQRSFSTLRRLHQEVSLQSEILSGDILPFEGPPIRYEASDEPAIRYEPSGVRSKEQSHALKHALGIDVLGTAAEVLVCRPDRRKRRLRFDANEQHTLKGEAEIDEAEMLDRLEQERSMADPDDARLNIEEIRDNWAQEKSIRDEYVGDEDYADLVEKLCDGFNKIQLLHFLEISGQSMEADVHDLSRPYASKSLSRSAWQSGTSPIQRSMAMPIRESGHTATRQSYHSYDKVSLAETIISNIWSIRRLSRECESGELELRLLPQHFHLLLNHRKQILRNTSEKYSVKLEIWKPRNSIRVTASRDVCGDIFRLFKFIIDSIQQQDLILPASCAEMAQVSRHVLIEQIESMTSTMITAKAIGTTGSPDRGLLCTIEYLGPDSKDLDDAKRLLCGRLPERHNPGARMEGHLRALSTMPSVVDIASCLPIQDRVRQWSRLLEVSESTSAPSVGPSKRRSSSHAISDERLFADVNRFVGLNGLPPRQERLESPVYWKRDITLFPTTALGQVVFSDTGMDKLSPVHESHAQLKAQIREINDKLRVVEQALDTKSNQRGGKVEKTGRVDLNVYPGIQELQGSVDRAYHRRQTKALNTKISEMQVLEKDARKVLQASERRFLPVVPGIASLMTRHGLEDVDASKTQMVDNSETISITLLPTLKGGHSPKILDAIPLLQIQLVLGKDATEPEIAHVRLTPGPVNLDIVFPDRSVDVRVSQYRSFRSRGDSIDPAIVQFLRESNLNVYGTERLSTPHNLDIQIPRFALDHKPRDDQTGDDLPELLDVTYVLKSLEIKSTLRIPYAFNTVLTYNSIEAGRLGGRREELTLQLPPPGSDPPKQRLIRATAPSQELSKVDKRELMQKQDEDTMRLWLAALRLMDEIEEKSVVDEAEGYRQIQAYLSARSKKGTRSKKSSNIPTKKKVVVEEAKPNERRLKSSERSTKGPSLKARAKAQKPAKLV